MALTNEKRGYRFKHKLNWALGKRSKSANTDESNARFADFWPNLRRNPRILLSSIGENLLPVNVNLSRTATAMNQVSAIKVQLHPRTSSGICLSDLIPLIVTRILDKNKTSKITRLCSADCWQKIFSIMKTFLHARSSRQIRKYVAQ